MNNSTIKTVVGVAGLAAAMMMTQVMASEHGAAAAGKVPSTNVAWTADMVRFVANGDKDRGAKLSQGMFCASCHGNAGIAPSANWPSMAGQRAEYTFKMLKDYKDGKRMATNTADPMVALSKMMSEQDMADLAQFYANFDLPELPKGVSFDAAQGAEVKPIIARGDGKRLIAPCQSCHSSGGEGAATDTPALAGQTPDYFIKTMHEYKSGTRHNDVYARMRVIAQALTDEEIVQMANYYAGMTAK